MDYGCCALRHSGTGFVRRCHLALAIGTVEARLTATELRRQHYENVSAQVADWLRSEVASYRQVGEHSERVVARADRHASDDGEGDDHPIREPSARRGALAGVPV